MKDMKIEWELPLSVLEEMLAFEFDLNECPTIIKCEFDSCADAMYLVFTVDSGDFERIPESTSLGRYVA